MTQKTPNKSSMQKYQSEISSGKLLTMENLVRISFGFVFLTVGAKILGVEKYGEFSYVISFAALFSFMSTFGLQLIVIREIKRNIYTASEIIQASILIRILGGLFLLTFASIAAYAISPEQQYLVSLASLVFLAQSPQAVRLYFEARLDLSNAIKYSMFAISASAILKIISVFYLGSIYVLVFIDLLTAIFLSFAYIQLANREELLSANVIRKNIVVELMKNAWPIALSSAAILVFSRIDQVMISNMVSLPENGRYALAASVVTALFFIPTILSQTLYPMMIKKERKGDVELNEFTAKKIELMLASAIITILVAILVFPKLIEILQMEGYESSINMFNVLVFSLVSVSLGIGSNKWLIAKNLQKISFYRTSLGALANIVLNFLFIPNFGATGAAAASVIAHIFSGYLGNLISKDTRQLFILQSRALSFCFLRRRIMVFLNTALRS